MRISANNVQPCRQVGRGRADIQYLRTKIAQQEYREISIFSNLPLREGHFCDLILGPLDTLPWLLYLRNICHFQGKYALLE